MSLNLTFSVQDKCTTLSLRGSLNEYSSALDGVEVNSSYDLNVNLKDLQGINSLGIRNFQNWVHAVRCEKLRMFFCPRAFINQLNMVHSFLPEKAEIESFFVPYFSEVTSEDQNVLFIKDQNFKKVNGKVELTFPKVFDSKNNEMELDVFKEHYFRFLDHFLR